MTRIPSQKLTFRGACMAFGALALIGLVLAGCGGGAGTSSSTSVSEPEAESTDGHEASTMASTNPVAHQAVAQTANASAVAVVKVMSTPGLGKVIVDADGMTLYDSHRDNPMIYQFDRPPIPTCYEACAEVWPPLLTDSAPKATGGAEGSLLGTIRRRDGSRQVTYDGHPLYEFVNDIQPGEATGDGLLSLGSEWHALEPDGEEPAAEGR